MFGDYDVDGITATCLLTDFLRRMGGKVVSYIPGRLEEGYGLNPIAISYLRDQGVSMIVTVDCGITAVAEAKLCLTLIHILGEVFGNLGVDGIISGGQTMNPSTQDILEAVNKVPAETVFILPNNKNIIMAAPQVEGLTPKQVVVIPSKTVPQGVTAMLSFNPEGSVEENTEAMNEALGTVDTMQTVSYTHLDVYKRQPPSQGP